MGDFIYEYYAEQYKFAKKLLEAAKKSEFQINPNVKISKSRLIKFLTSTIRDLKIGMNALKNCETSFVDKFTEIGPKSPIELQTTEGKTLHILTKEQTERMKWEIEEIEKYYPGENYLTEQEKMCKKSFQSLHDYQLFISRIRQGMSEIIKNGDGSITLFMTL